MFVEVQYDDKQCAFRSNLDVWDSCEDFRKLFCLIPYDSSEMIHDRLFGGLNKFRELLRVHLIK